MSRFISIVTLNYNGKQFLEDFFNSAKEVDYPKDGYEIIMVDNKSTDGSVRFVEENFPEVKIINAEANLGFGKGNNLGIKAAKGGLVYLLNNDTVLTKESLKGIVKCFNKWDKKTKVGAINAKLVMIDSYLPLLIEEAHFSDYTLPKGAEPTNTHPLVISQETKSTFYEKVQLPISHEYEDSLRVKLELKKFRKDSFVIKLGGEVLHKGQFKSLSQGKTIDLELSKKDVAKHKTDLIQNAGNMYFRDGSGRDRGVIIYKHKQYFEEDKGQYDDSELIKGFCGAGVLLNKKALDKVGYFDPDFFLYYEDSDLSFRLREGGWKIAYCPESVVRHIHSATNKEWSDFFIYHAEKGKLLFLAKHWPRALALKEWVKYLARTTFAHFAYHLLKKNFKEAFSKLRLRLKVNLSVLIPFFRSLMGKTRMTYGEIKELN